MKFIKVALFSALSLLVLIIATIIFSVSYWSHLTSTSLGYWTNLVIKNFSSSPTTSLSLLILGQDPRSDQIETSLATDTILIGRYRPGSFNAISLPRDLWDETSSSRINRFYQNSVEAKLTGPQLWSTISQEYFRVTGVMPQKHLLITTADLVNIIKIMGGIDVKLNYDFTDTQYPNPQYINNPTPATPVYITVTYKKGINHLDESNILPFVRSRKASEDPALGGTDLGRIARQQLVISAISQKIASLSVTQKIILAADFYRYFHDHMLSSLTDSDLFLLIKRFVSHPQLAFNFCTVPVFPEDPNGLIYHPPSFGSNAWVYLPLAKDYQALHQFTATCLNQ
jgi:anionic cell wall polymer biosynthesis LytR-Cps2A-Psr (LCP) family protein